MILATFSSLSKRSPSTIDTRTRNEDLANRNAEIRLTFIDNENFSAQPPCVRLLVLPNLGHKLVGRLNTDTSPSEGMESDPTNVTGSDTSRCGNGNSIVFLGMLQLELRNDLPKEDGFASAFQRVEGINH